MENKLVHVKGFTLIELIIALVMSGFLLFTASMLVVYTQDSWQKAFKKSTETNDVLTAQRKLDFMLRTGTAPQHPGANAPSWGAYNIPTASTLQFQNLDRKLGKFVFHQISLNGTQLVDSQWTATGTQYKPGDTVSYAVDPTLGLSPTSTAVLLQNVSAVQFQQNGATGAVDKAIQINLTAANGNSKSTVKVKAK